MQFVKQLNATIAVLNHCLCTLSTIRKYLDVNIMTLIYKQTILPYLDYIALIADSLLQDKVRKLQVLQNRALRIVYGKKGYVSSAELDSMHVESKLQKLEDRRKYFVLKLIHKYSKVTENVDRRWITTFVRGSRKVKMKLLFSDKTKVRKSPYYRGVHLWNQIDYKIQHIEGERMFGKAIRRMDLSRDNMYEENT